MDTAATTSPTQQAASPILAARGLARSFRMGDQVVEVLKNVNLSVRRGEFVAIEGRSGSGKSTLLHILGALDMPDAGTVQYDGQSLVDSAASRRSRIRNRHFGFVFQFYHLLPELNVLENTLLAPMIENSWLSYLRQRRELRQRAATLLNELGIGHRLHHRPGQLSGGERQRVAIARALMNQPQVLFADEPTGNLDAQTGRQIMDLLERLHRQHGQTIVMVTHDRTIAAKTDRILVLREGRLEKASHENADL